MEPILFVVLGIAIALLVHVGLGVLFILIGLGLALWPYIPKGRNH